MDFNIYLKYVKENRLSRQLQTAKTDADCHDNCKQLQCQKLQTVMCGAMALACIPGKSIVKIWTKSWMMSLENKHKLISVLLYI